jgi:hypothetical protein
MPTVAENEWLVAAIKPLLADRAPGVQGAVLAELVAMFLAGYHPDVRDEMLSLHMTAVRDLVPLYETELFAHPPPPGSPPFKS